MGQFQVGEWEWDCSFCNIFRAQKWILRLYIFLLFVTGSAQQAVQLLPFNISSVECFDGSVIIGKDQVVMTGFVDTAAPYPIAIEFQKRRVGGSFSTDCPLVIASSGSCVGHSIAPCYCQSISGTTYTVVYNRTADERDSSASLVLLYNGSPSTTQSMPVVRNVEQVDVTFSGATYSLLNVCDHLSGETIDFKICARNLENVTFFIGIDASVGPWHTAINNCSSFSQVKLPETGSLTFAYRETTGCRREDSLNCTISEKVVSDEGCDTTCIIIIVVVVVVVVGGAGIAIGVFYYFRKKRGKITTCVIIIEVSATLIEVETMVIKKANRQGHQLPDCERVIKYKGKKQDDKNMKLEDLIFVHKEVTVKVTVNVCRDGTFVLDEIVCVAVLDISVKADESLDQLQNMVKTEVSAQHPKAKLGILIFLLDGKEQDKSMKLGKLFPGLKDGTKLTVIVYLESQDGSHKCELKKPETTESSANSSSKRNNAVRDSPL